MIEGVIIKALKTHDDHRGFFREIFRFSEEYNDVPVGQLSHSLVKEGVFKGWHGHKYQSQWNYVISGRIHIALHDARRESRSYRETMQFFAGDGETPKGYFFPRGILHAYKCVKGPMQIIYVTSGVYDLSDEIRLPFDDPEIGFKWKK